MAVSNENQYPHLYIMDRTGELRDVVIDKSMTIGRKTANADKDILLESAITSKNHGRISLTGDQILYCDTNSSNGTVINGKIYGAVTGVFEKVLEDGDIIRIENPQDPAGNDTVVMIYRASVLPGCSWKRISLPGKYKVVSIGRKKETNVIALHDARCSRKHAAMQHESNGVWTLRDLNSGNGVFYNGRKIGSHVDLRKKDFFRVVDYFFLFTGDYLYYYSEEEAVPASPENEIEVPMTVLRKPQQVPSAIPGTPQAPGAVKTPGTPQAPGAGQKPVQKQVVPQRTNRAVSNGKNLEIDITARTARQGFKTLTLLKDIHITVKSGEMVLILGGSGAGKTTFMNAVMGYEKAKGTIRYGETDIYSEYEKMKYEIGFVPQDILLRENDTVYDTLYNSAQMKLTDHPEIWEDRVKKVLEMVSLSHVQDSLVKSVSGGEKKRVSAGVELIADPSLFFLDEPDSGLDAYSATELMENLRRIADMGKIVMVISHSPDRAAELFDKVVILAKSRVDNSGHLAFYGSVEETKKFFGADTLEGVVGKINSRDADIEGYINRWNSLGRRQ